MAGADDYRSGHQAIIRQLVERVVVTLDGATEHVA